MVLRIQALSTDLANQIAAGEVIERPASVVKELLENARDAKASTIQVELDYAGLNRISVADNGVGIHADDLPLAVTAHATSKIKTLDDLFSIHTMGFRGEALASIASVARLSMQTRTHSDKQGSQLRFDNGRWQVLPVARQCGTTVEVCDLFYNAPVRKRFLKSERTEFLAVDTVIRRFAMSTPEIALKVRHNDKQVLDLPAAADDARLTMRLQKLFGKPFIESAKYIDETRQNMRLRGWISDTDYQRSHADKQWIYVNQRMVRDKLLNHALKQAYETTLYPGRYPACLLYLTVNPAEVDVNVHPTKHELRFQQPRLVHDFVYSQILQHLDVSAQPQQLPLSRQNNIAASPARGVSRWQISESEQALLQRQENVPLDNVSSAQWLPLQKGFLVINIQQRHYLCCRQALIKHALSWHLQQQTLPLPARPLLVPIRHTLAATQATECQTYLPLLKRVGIETNLVNNILQWRSVPVLMPQLPLPEILSHLFQLKPCDELDMISLLVQTEVEQAGPISEATKTQMVAFLGEKQAEIEQNAIPGVIQLTDNICEKIVYG